MEDIKCPKECRRTTCTGCSIQEEVIKTHPRGNVNDILIIDGVKIIVTETRSGYVFGTKPFSKDVDIRYYDNNAERYFNSTKDANFDSNRQILIKYLRSNDHILDLGCGSGRDSKVFIDLGYKVTALDGSKKLCELAAKVINQEVICKDYYQINDIDRYNAIWACASLFHLTNVELVEVLNILQRALKADGYFYLCFKYGLLEREDTINVRHFNDMTENKFNEILKQLEQLRLLEYVVTGYELQRDNAWLNIVLKKTK